MKTSYVLNCQKNCPKIDDCPGYALARKLKGYVTYRLHRTTLYSVVPTHAANRSNAFRALENKQYFNAVTI